MTFDNDQNIYQSCILEDLTYVVYKIPKKDKFFVVFKDENKNPIKQGPYEEDSNELKNCISELKNYRKDNVQQFYEYSVYIDYLKNSQFVVQEGDLLNQIYIVVKNKYGVFYEEDFIEDHLQKDFVNNLKNKGYKERDCLPVAKRRYLIDSEKKKQFFIYYQENPKFYYILGTDEVGEPFEYGGFNYDKKLENKVSELLIDGFEEYTDLINLQFIMLKNEFQSRTVCNKRQFEKDKKEKVIDKQKCYKLKNPQQKCCSKNKKYAIIYQTDETKIEYSFQFEKDKQEIKYITKKEVKFNTKNKEVLNLHEFRIDIEKTIFKKKNDHKNLFFYY